MKIGMFSFADIDNYGDILFSRIFKMEIESRLSNVEIDFITPTQVEIEGFRYQAYTKDMVDGKYDALVLAGGEVVHLFDERTWNPIYAKHGRNILSGLASNVVWDWLDCDCNFKAWLSVGVRPFGDKWDENKIDESIDRLDYIATRGIL